MIDMTPSAIPASHRSHLDRALSLFTDVRAGEGATAVLMLVNISLLLVCYSVIKTVREPLILLGGGAEVRSYAAAGQALLLMGFVPLYAWLASRVDRARLLVGVTLFFIVCIELFAAAVAAHMPYVGVAFFIWVGIFNISLVAQFWSFANDIYSKDAGGRLFPIIVMGMTAGAPLGSFIAARLFRQGVAPQVILQLAAVLLSATVGLYLWINSRESQRVDATANALPAGGGFHLVLGSGYLRLIALLIVLLNVVNTTGEYLVARMLTDHAHELALANPGFDKQAYIGAFSGEYQFWVNVTALLLQAFVASRLVKYRGLAGVLLALPLIALGGYAIVAAGVGFSVVRWVKTMENATDYSIMNTARQLLWLPTTREEKYKAKQAIDTFFVRAGDVLSAGAVYVGTSMLKLDIAQFAVGNVVLTTIWIGVAMMLLNPSLSVPRIASRRLAGAMAMLLLMLAASPVLAQETREEELAAAQARKASELRPYEAEPLERRIMKVESLMTAERPVYAFVGGVLEGGGIAAGPGYRARFADSGALDAHTAWSYRNYKVADATLRLPAFADHRVTVAVRGRWLDAPSVAFHGVGNGSVRTDDLSYAYRETTAGVNARIQAARAVAFGGGIDAIAIDTGAAADPNYRRSRLFAEVDSRDNPGYTRHGGLYRVEWSDYQQTNAGAQSFRRLDAEVDQFVPVLRENWVIALRGLVSTTDTAARQAVPYYLMPSLGGTHALRGYSAWRFRDANRVLLSGEYRWTAGPFVDMAIFVDAGKVTETAGDLDLSGLKTAHGIGVSFHTPTSTVLRVELARSHEGTGVSFSFGPSF